MNKMEIINKLKELARIKNDKGKYVRKGTDIAEHFGITQAGVYGSRRPTSSIPHKFDTLMAYHEIVDFINNINGGDNSEYVAFNGNKEQILEKMEWVLASDKNYEIKIKVSD
jgi:hypothetical protein